MRLSKIYDNAKDNAAFDRCVDVMARLMLKYGNQVLEHRGETARFLYLNEPLRTKSAFWRMLFKKIAIYTLRNHWGSVIIVTQRVFCVYGEIERENIRTQTMAGREQKAREGKWNGGFAPYGYRLEKGELLIAEDEAEIIRVIYDRYIHTSDGLVAVANYLNNHGYTKKVRQNGTIPRFSSNFVKDVLDNPVYMGKIA